MDMAEVTQHEFEKPEWLLSQEKDKHEHTKEEWEKEMEEYVCVVEED